MFQAVSFTHKGNVREINEDYLLFNSKDGLFIVADGVGGSNAGEVASQFVATNLYDILINYEEVLIAEELAEILKKINNRLIEQSKSSSLLTGMGTTLVFLVHNHGHTFIGNVGDSRAYLFRKGILSQITKDHSLVQEMVDSNAISPEEAFNHPLKNIITMAMGNETISPDIFEQELLEKDTILLCSDGLTDMVTDSEIETILKQDDSLDDRLELLKERVFNYGARDNLSLILISIQK